jgi:hypothetical protein
VIEGERYCFHMKFKKTSNCDSEAEYIYIWEQLLLYFLCCMVKYNFGDNAHASKG